MKTTCVAATMVVSFAVTSVATDVNWKAAESGDFNLGTNWEGGAVPGAGDTAVIEQTGSDYTVTLSATPTASPKSITVGNSDSNSAKVEIAGEGTKVVLDETRFKIKKNGTIRIADGADLQLKALTASSSDPIFQGDNGQRHGDLVLDRATMTIDWAHSYFIGKSFFDGQIVLTNGAVMTFRENGTASEAFHMSGWDSAMLRISDTSKIVAENNLPNTGNGGSGQFLLANVELSGDAEISCPMRAITFTSPSFFRLGVGQIRTAHAVIKDNAKIDNGTSNQSFYINDSGYDDSSIVVDYSTSWRGLSTYGIHIGQSAHNATLNLSGGTLITNYGNGFNIGDPNGVAKGCGTLNVTNAAVYNRSSGQYASSLYSFAVGTSEWGNLSNNSFGRGTVNVYDGGAITNSPSSVALQSGCYFNVGASLGEGEVNQYGGVIAHRSRYQMIIGVRGGTGRYSVMGGVSDVESDVYVGGIPYDRLQGVVEGIDYAADATFRAKYNYTKLNASGSLKVAGGVFQTVSNLYVSASGKGMIEIGGDTNTLLSANDIVLTKTVDGDKTYVSDVVFTVGADGVGVLKANGRLIIGDGAKLKVAVTEMPEASWTKLIEYGEIDGEFASIEFDGEGEIVKRTRKGVNAYWLHKPKGLALILR